MECSAVRGTVNLIEEMAVRVRLEQTDTCQLLSGQRGSGKTTELNRLARDLAKGNPSYFVVQLETPPELLSDVEYPDVLLAILNKFWQRVTDEGVRLHSMRLRSLFEAVADVVSSVRLKEVEAGEGIVKLTAEVEKNTTTRALVRESLRPRAPTLVEAINETIDAAREELTRKGFAGIVIIVDNLDRILPDVIRGTERLMHEALFIDAADYLRGLRCNVIYTIPPALFYSPSALRLWERYGTEPVTLPMIPTRTRQDAENPEGIAKLREMIDERVKYAGTEMGRVFENEAAVLRLIRVSGGYERGLISLVKRSLLSGKLPITSAAVDLAVSRSRDAFIRVIRDPQHWQLLRDVAAGKRLGTGADSMKLLENFAILEYRDSDGPWYDVNPLAREAPAFRV